VALDGFNDDNRVVHHQADGQHQAKSDKVFIEKPSSGKIMKVPTSETGTANSGIKVARQFCRKMKTTIKTSRMASNSVCTISLMPSKPAVWCPAKWCSPDRSGSALLIPSCARAPRSRRPARWNREFGKRRCWQRDAVEAPDGGVVQGTQFDARHVGKPHDAPSGVARTMIEPNSAGLIRRPWVRTVKVISGHAGQVHRQFFRGIHAALLLDGRRKIRDGKLQLCELSGCTQIRVA